MPISAPARYLFTEYSSEWPKEFAREAAELRLLFEGNLVEAHHIGSTSVPGLAAKPIIDVLPVVSSIEAVDQNTSNLEQAGYRAWGEYGIPGRRYFTKQRAAYRTHNVHVFQQNDPEIERHLAFCAYLRAHQNARDEYASLKRAIYARYPSDIEAYSDGKNAWIKRAEKAAVEWYRRANPGQVVKGPLLDASVQRS